MNCPPEVPKLGHLLLVFFLLVLVVACQSREEQQAGDPPTASPESDAGDPGKAGTAGQTDTTGKARPAPLPPLITDRFPAQKNVLTADLFQRLPGHTELVFGIQAHEDGRLQPSVLHELLTQAAAFYALPAAESAAVVEFISGPAGVALLPEGELIVCATLPDPDPAVSLVAAVSGTKATQVSSGSKGGVASWKFEGRPWTVTAIGEDVYVVRAPSQARAQSVADSIAGGSGLGDKPAFINAVEATAFGQTAGLYLDARSMYQRSFKVVDDKLTGLEDPALRPHLEHRHAGIRALWSRLDAIAVGFAPATTRIDIAAVAWWDDGAPELQPVSAQMPVAAGWESPVVLTFKPLPGELEHLAALAFQDFTGLNLRTVLKDAGLNLDRDVLPALSGQLALGLRWTFHPSLPDLPVLEPTPMVSLQLNEDADIDAIWEKLAKSLADHEGISVADDGKRIVITVETAAVHIERGDHEIAVWAGPAAVELSAFAGGRSFSQDAAEAHEPLSRFEGMLGQVDIALDPRMIRPGFLQQHPKDAVCRPNNRRFTVPDEEAREAYCAVLSEAQNLDQAHRQIARKAAETLFSSLRLRATLSGHPSGNGIVARGAIYPDEGDLSGPVATAVEQLSGLAPDELSKALEVVNSARENLEVERAAP